MADDAAEEDEVIGGVFHVPQGGRLFDHLTVTEKAEVPKAYLEG